MNIEDLSKAQLLLLMILVNFVTSIATGVLTVSLLDQAPATVTQTVNRIVDHTIETVATGTPLAAVVTPPPAAIKTTIVNTDDLRTAAVAADASRTVGIYGSTGTTSPLIAYGTYLPTARAVVTATTDSLPKQVTIVFPDDSTRSASLSKAGATLTIYGFGDTEKLPAASSPQIIAHTSVKQGASTVALTSDGSAITGIVSKVDADGVHTNLAATPAGSSAVDLSGNIIGISSGLAGLYFPADKITTLLNATTSPASS